MQIYACKIYKLKSLKTIFLSIKYLQSKQFEFMRQHEAKKPLDLSGNNIVEYDLNFDNIFGLAFSSLLPSDTYSNVSIKRPVLSNVHSIVLYYLCTCLFSLSNVLVGFFEKASIE